MLIALTTATRYHPLHLLSIGKIEKSSNVCKFKYKGFLKQVYLGVIQSLKAYPQDRGLFVITALTKNLKRTGIIRLYIPVC